MIMKKIFIEIYISHELRKKIFYIKLNYISSISVRFKILYFSSVYLSLITDNNKQGFKLDSCNKK